MANEANNHHSGLLADLPVRVVSLIIKTTAYDPADAIKNE